MRRVQKIPMKMESPQIVRSNAKQQLFREIKVGDRLSSDTISKALLPTLYRKNGNIGDIVWEGGRVQSGSTSL